MKYINWFCEGLKFSCQRCGKCCKGPGGYVWITEEEAEILAKEIGITKEIFYKKYLRRVNNKLSLIDNYNGDCIFMDEEGRCKYYKQRPSQCKTFPWWPEIIASSEVWESNPYNCPGVGVGKLYTEEEILENLHKNN